ncbi:GNAT family N-acetyltransferase [candidate division WOR-3 bacterium]|nr:GNAT family N-acetyltransferase [candidate division WOR-3 bacterium]
MRIEELEEINHEEWDRFVKTHKEGRFCHLIGYRDVIKNTYGYKDSYWIAKNRDKIIGIFPSFIKKTLFGNRIISQPFTEYGGPLFKVCSVEKLLLLKEKIKEVLKEYKLPFLEIHGGFGIPRPLMSQVFVEKALHKCAVLKLTTSKDIWKNVDYSVRKAIQKAERSELKCYKKVDEETILHKFYPLYLLSMKRFGTPPHPEEFYLNFYKYLGKNMKLFLIDFKGKTISALLGFTTGKRIHIISIASNNKYWDMRPNDLAHWEFVKWGCKNGYKVFDFGPVRYEGQMRYKKKWGCGLYDYPFYYICRKHLSMPIKGGASCSMKLAILWKKMIPLKLGALIGQYIRREIGR